MAGWSEADAVGDHVADREADVTRWPAMTGCGRSTPKVAATRWTRVRASRCVMRLSTPPVQVAGVIDRADDGGELAVGFTGVGKPTQPRVQPAEVVCRRRSRSATARSVDAVDLFGDGNEPRLIRSSRGSQLAVGVWDRAWQSAGTERRADAGSGVLAAASAEFRGGSAACQCRTGSRDFPAPNPQPTACVLWQGPVDQVRVRGAVVASHARPMIRPEAAHGRIGGCGRAHCIDDSGRDRGPASV